MEKKKNPPTVPDNDDTFIMKGQVILKYFLLLKSANPATLWFCRPYRSSALCFVRESIKCGSSLVSNRFSLMTKQFSFMFVSNNLQCVTPNEASIVWG